MNADTKVIGVSVLTNCATEGASDTVNIDGIMRHIYWTLVIRRPSHKGEALGFAPGVCHSIEITRIVQGLCDQCLFGHIALSLGLILGLG